MPVEGTQEERGSRFRTEGKDQNTNLRNTEPLLAVVFPSVKGGC